MSNKNSKRKSHAVYLSHEMPTDSVWANGVVLPTGACQPSSQDKPSDNIEEELDEYISFFENLPEIKNVTDFTVTLKRVSERVHNPYSVEWIEKKFKPDEVDCSHIIWSNPSEEAFLKMLGRKREVNIQNLLLLVDYFNACRYKQYVLTRKHLAPLLKKKPSTIAFIIEMAKSVDLIRKISIVPASYIQHIANVYIFNPNLVSLLERIRNRKIDESIKSGKGLFYNYSLMVSGFEDRVKISSRMRLPKFCSDARCNELLATAIPFLRYYQNKAERFSEDLDDELKVNFIPNIERTVSYITKIGLRFSSPCASYKKKYEKVNWEWVLKPENPNYEGEYKEDFLERHFGKDWRQLGRFDMKSSIYRLTHFLNFGEWLENSVDLYAKILGHEFSSAEERAAIKDLAMTVYFLKSAKDMRAKKDYCLCHMKLSKQEAENYLQQLKDQMEDVIGPSFGSMIFVYESCLYMDIVYDLRFKYGYDKIVWIYDEWIADKPDRTIRRDTEKIIKSRLEEWKRIFIGKEDPYAVRGESPA